MALKGRNVGLDYIRTFAILFVLISHARHLFTYIDSVNWWLLSLGGYLGVELFFVLSGFLIGRILIEKVLLEDNRLLAFKSFMIRRWFRTLPLYYLILLVYVVVASLEQQTLFFSWSHLVFLQNFSSEGLKFFAVSWSLSVEEWFYLCIPLILFIGIRLFGKNKANSIFISIVFVLVSVILLKFFLVSINLEWTWTDVRKNIFLRADSLLIGVLMAYIQYYHISLFKSLGTMKVFIINIFMLLFLISWYYYQGDVGLSKDLFSKAFMFTITSWSLSIVVVYFYYNVGKKLKFFEYGSKLSYSIYLIHFLFLEFFIQQAHKYQELYLSCIFLFFFLLLTVSISYILYRYYEMPMMNLREKFS